MNSFFIGGESPPTERMRKCGEFFHWWRIPSLGKCTFDNGVPAGTQIVFPILLDSQKGNQIVHILKGKERKEKRNEKERKEKKESEKESEKEKEKEMKGKRRGKEGESSSDRSGHGNPIVHQDYLLSNLSASSTKKKRINERKYIFSPLSMFPCQFSDHNP